MLPVQNSPKVIGFDLDQTLYPKSPEIDDAIQTYLYDKISYHLKVPRAEAQRRFKELYHGAGISGSQSLLRLGIPNAKDTIQEALEKANIAEYLQPDPQTLSLLKNIKQKYGHIDIVTGSNRSNTLKKLTHMAIPAELFKHVITASDGPKSDGTTYRLWLSKYPQYSPDQFLYIGDRAASDYYSPRELGIKTILVYVNKSESGIDCPQLKTLKDIATILL
ncbi:MAG: HAD family hydrolase [Candidatus Saccharimonadales bacterium]